MRGIVILEQHPMTGRWLSVSGRVTFGRDGCDIVMPDPEVSRAHALLEVDDGPPSLEDLGSLNGTWVNGGRIRKVHVHDGDVLRFGNTVWHVVAPPASGTWLTTTSATRARH